MKIPETPEEIREAITKLDWDVCEVKLHVVKKIFFGVLRKDFSTQETWAARLLGKFRDPAATPKGNRIIGVRRFSVDTRLGEDYAKEMTQAFEDLMGDLFQQGWELSEDANPYSRPIYLQRPPSKRR